jgi:hypothetical protein
MLEFSVDRWATLIAFAALLAGCNPEIGDECSVSTDCSRTGDRLCDTTMPGGYCTIFNCEPGTCPSEAVCVAFETAIAKECKDPQSGTRLTRTFCMRNCESDSDCRSDYACVDLAAKDDPWGAEIIESGDRNGAVCIPPYSAAPLPDDHSTEVCTGTDAGFDVTPWEPDAEPESDAAADSSADASDSGDDAGLDGGSDAADAADAADDAADAGSDAPSDA